MWINQNKEPTKQDLQRAPIEGELYKRKRQVKTESNKDCQNTFDLR